MILDSISNGDLYAPLHPGFAQAFQFLKGLGTNWKEGRYELEGERLYATIALPETSPLKGRDFEAHCRYIDLHCILEGEELLEYADIRFLNQKSSYDEEKDVCFYEGEGSVIRCRPGDFYIVYPQDAHKPCGSGGKTPLCKAIIKILLPY